LTDIKIFKKAEMMQNFLHFWQSINLQK
jgi:hypothetical protein